MFSLESPRRGDSNEYIIYIIFNIKKKTTLNYPKSAAMGFCAKGIKKEFETAVVNETSVFEPSKVYCIMHCIRLLCNVALKWWFIYFCELLKEQYPSFKSRYHSGSGNKQDAKNVISVCKWRHVRLL